MRRCVVGLGARACKRGAGAGGVPLHAFIEVLGEQALPAAERFTAAPLDPTATGLEI